METKICSDCKKDKPLSEYHKNAAKKDGLGTACKECRKEYIRKHYLNNKQYYLDNASERKKLIVEWFKELKRDLECETCGENHPACLEFHHINPENKDMEVSRLVKFNKSRVLKEIKKCKVLCSNCHRKLHYEMGRLL